MRRGGCDRRRVLGGVRVSFPTPEVHGEGFEVDRVAARDGVRFCRDRGRCCGAVRTAVWNTRSTIRNECDRRRVLGGVGVSVPAPEVHGEGFEVGRVAARDDVRFRLKRRCVWRGTAFRSIGLLWRGNRYGIGGGCGELIRYMV